MKIYRQYLLVLVVLFGMMACNSDNREKKNTDQPLHENNESDVTPAVDAVKAKQDGTIRLVSYNVGVFNKYLTDDYQLIADMMKEVEADVVCMNELDSVTTRTNNVFQLEYVSECLGGWNFCYGPAMSYKGGKYGEGLTSHLKPVKQFYIPLEKGDGAEPRVLVVMEFEKFVVATTHLDHKGATAQKNQAEKVNAVMQEFYGNTKKTVFLGGDLNAKPDSETMSTFKNVWTIISDTSEFTISTENPKSCIDYFLLLNNGAEVNVVHSQVITKLESGDVTKASDHFPVLVDIELSE